MGGPVIVRKVVSKLLLPQEITCAFAFIFVEVIDNISVVHLNSDKGNNDLS